MPTKSELEPAYRATTYQVFLPPGMVALRIGSVDASFVRWLLDEAVTDWAILTACNPAGERFADAANAERQSALEVALLERGFEPYAGENLAESADWPVEATCLVPNISLPEALGFARQFKQNAIVHGSADGEPRLLWVENQE
jgi:hypothetical protein